MSSGPAAVMRLATPPKVAVNVLKLGCYLLLSHLLWGTFFLYLGIFGLPLRGKDVKLPDSLPGQWQSFGRGEVVSGQDSVTIKNAYVADLKPLGDCEISFRARMPQDMEAVQIWGAIRVKDRNDRYVFGLRGGTEPEISFARYAPDANAKFLGFAPLDFKPVPGTWYKLRVAVVGNHFQVYINDDKLPRINVEDQNAPWADGGVGLGGGWLPTEFTDLKITPLTDNDKSAFAAVGNQTWVPPAVDKEALRQTQRAAYTPVKILQLPDVRGEISLDGNWLFMPDQDWAGGSPPTGLDVVDQSWHVLAVPSFWTPFLGWLHGEDGVSGLKKGLSASRGPSDELVMEEEKRADAQTFDWKNTKSGWYREYLDLPGNISGRQFNLVFDAIAKISKIYVNGTQVGAHTGMFGEIDCDITGAVKPGHNVIAVHVIGKADNKFNHENKAEATAVTETVTTEMLQSIPHGMAPDDSSGIWQPVKLVVSNPIRAGEIFIRPRLDGASADVELFNADAQSHRVDLSYTITDCKDKSVLNAETKVASVTIPANGRITARIETPKLLPKLWSPQTPNLYMLNVKLTAAGKTLDERPTRFGFRTFTVSGSQFLLNGKPFWLRGANHFPATLRPNDSVLAHKFTDLARDGNVTVTRTHAVPFTQAWLDAADEEGMGVSFEGTWPWLMIHGAPPSADLIAVWHNEFAGLLRRNRNHPAILIWTVNNEMNFARFDERNIPLLMKKWGILDDMIRTMRQTDPTRPICAYSNYQRADAKKSFDEVVTPNHFDDGDIDDSHKYYGWYSPSFFNLFNGEFGKTCAVPNRPLISQEMSTGYPRNDGWPSRSYEFDRYVPEALVGDYAYEQSDPLIFLKRQAFMTKELVETIRRTNRREVSGILGFAYLTWFKDVWNADKIQPGVAYFELKKALQPVLVSAELYGRHFYAGAKSSHRVCLINDDISGQDIPPGTLTWQVQEEGQTLAEGTQPTPAVPYYSNQWLNVEVKMPDSLAGMRGDAKLVFTLAAGEKTHSINDYDIVVASKEWASVVPGTKIQLFDPSSKAAASTAGLDTVLVNSFDSLSPVQPLIIGDLNAALKDGDGNKLKAFVESGGRVLLLNPETAFKTLFPEFITSYRSTHGEIVTMQIPESPVFDGIEPLDTAWFEMGRGTLPYACSGTYGVDRNHAEVTTPALQCDIHGDLNKGGYPKIAGAPLVEVHLGKGIVVASEMMLSTKDNDPIAGRLLANLIAYLRSAPATH
jgi:hypothetical protein